MFQGKPVFLGQREAVGFEVITDVSTAKSLTVPPGAIMAIIQCETQNCRWKDDGASPTSSAGMLITANDYFIYTGILERFKIIETSATASVNISYYK
jgi:hypothetical protein